MSRKTSPDWLLDEEPLGGLRSLLTNRSVSRIARPVGLPWLKIAQTWFPLGTAALLPTDFGEGFSYASTFVFTISHQFLSVAANRTQQTSLRGPVLRSRFIFQSSKERSSLVKDTIDAQSDHRARQSVTYKWHEPVDTAFPG